MKILLDHCVPHSLRRFFTGHTVETTAYNGWEQLSNGRLLNAAQERGFDALITVDRNVPYQQNMTGRTVRILVLEAENNLTATLAPMAPMALAALAVMQPGELKAINLDFAIEPDSS